MSDKIDHSAIFNETTNDASASCFNDTMPATMDFSASKKISEPTDGFISLNSIFEKETVPEGAKVVDEMSLVSAKGGRNCELIQNVLDADRAVENAPLLDKQIAKQENALAGARKDLAEVTNKLKDDIYGSLGKGDWAALEKLGPSPITFDKLNRPTIDFNNAQRAWLKQNQPELYKKLEIHDSSTLNERRAANGLDALQAIKDKPISARLDLANFYRNNGQNDAAISTLTEVARMQRSKEQEMSFRKEARESGAAWDRGFRKAIESAGGNILDYVHRPATEFRGMKDKALIQNLKRFRN